MTTAAQSIEAIQKAALQLQPAARAQLTHALIQSLATLSEPEVAKLWLAEAGRRDAEMDSGQVPGIPGDEVFRRLYARYRK